MNYFKENLSFLKQSSETLYNAVKKEKAILNLEIHPVESQDNYYVKNGDVECFLHSIYNVNREIKNSFKRVPEDVENIVLFGLGCGHYIDYISCNYKKLNKVIIVEPSMDIFKKLLEKKDLYKLIEELDTSTFIINKNAEDTALIMIEMLQKNLKRKTAIVYNISYRSLFKKYFDSIEDYLSQYVRELMTNTLTREYFKQRWPINVFKNLSNYEPFFVENCKKQFEGRTAILVSGGPSLEKNMHLIKSVEDKAVIFAVGSAIKILDSNGITPHFRIAVDGNDGQLKIFKDIDTDDCPLIHGTSSFYRIPEIYSGDIFRTVLKSDFLTKYIYDKSGIKHEPIDVGTSVANVAIDLICKLGFGKVVFMGQDLCYSDNKLYAKGSWTNENIEDFESQKTELIKEKNIYGETVYTNIPFLNMRSSLEQKIAENKRIIFINATEGGLNIKGTEIKDFKDIKELKNQDIDISQIMKKIRLSYDHEEYIRRLKSGIKLMKHDIEAISSLNEDIIDLISSSEGKSIQNQYLERTIETIDEKERRIKENEFYKKVVDAYIGDLLNAVEHGIKSNDLGGIESIEERFKISLNIAMELKEYIELIELLIEEFEGKRKLNIKYLD